jgi:hypothetical protein
VPRRRHIAMVITDGRKTCACTLHPCPASPQLGDPLCRVCRGHCYPELTRRARNRRRILLLAVALSVSVVGWLAGRIYSVISGG